MDHSHDRYYTPDEEFRIARAVWDSERDGKHAAHHLAAALVGDPHDAERLALLDEIIVGTAEPLAIAPLSEEGNYFGAVALRAYVLAKTGQVAEGAELLAQVHHARPEVPYLDWAVAWLSADHEAALRVSRDQLAHFAGTLISRCPGNVIDVPAVRAELALALRFLDAALVEERPPAMLSYCRSALLRKVGRLDEAEQVALAAYGAEPNYPLATALALVAQSRGDSERWMHWQREALRHDPTDTAVRRDLGDWYLGRGAYAEAARWYQEAVDIEPDDHWSVPSLYYANHKLGLGDEWLRRLQAFARALPDNDRARFLLSAERPYSGHLPSPREATVNVLPRLIEEHREKGELPGDEFTFSVSSMEAPSARLAFALQIKALGGEPELSYNLGEIQSPDPRQPRRKARHQIWRYPKGSTDPLPAVGEPRPDAAREAARIAGAGFARANWFTAAGEAVRRLPNLRPEELLGVMAHPPEMPEGWYAPDWVLRCQVAAAMMAAHLDADQPWAGSTRREVLLDLVYGPMDWAVTAALVALMEACLRDEDVYADAKQALIDLLKAPNRPGYVPWEHAAACLIQELPGVPDAVRDHFANVQAGLEEEEEGDNED